MITPSKQSIETKESKWNYSALACYIDTITKSETRNINNGFLFKSCDIMSTIFSLICCINHVVAFEIFGFFLMGHYCEYSVEILIGVAWFYLSYLVILLILLCQRPSGGIVFAVGISDIVFIGGTKTTAPASIAAYLAHIWSRNNGISYHSESKLELLLSLSYLVQLQWSLIVLLLRYYRHYFIYIRCRVIGYHSLYCLVINTFIAALFTHHTVDIIRIWHLFGAILLHNRSDTYSNTDPTHTPTPHPIHTPTPPPTQSTISQLVYLVVIALFFYLESVLSNI